VEETSYKYSCWGLLGLANLGGIARGVEGLVRKHMSSGRLIFFSIFRLTILTAILTILVIYKRVNIFGLLIGFTVVFIVIMKEGLRASKEM